MTRLLNHPCVFGRGACIRAFTKPRKEASWFKPGGYMGCGHQRILSRIAPVHRMRPNGRVIVAKVAEYALARVRRVQKNSVQFTPSRNSSILPGLILGLGVVVALTVGVRWKV